MYRDILGPRLRQARIAAGLSGARLAGLIEKSQPYISDLERGERVPSLHTLHALANALDKPVTYFLSEELPVAAGDEASPAPASTGAAGAPGPILVAVGYLSTSEEARPLIQRLDQAGIRTAVFSEPDSIEPGTLFGFLEDALGIAANPQGPRSDRPARARLRSL